MRNNQKHHYVELNHKSSVKDILWELGEKVKQQKLIEVTYQKQVHHPEVVKRVVQPVAIIFSEYYFYLNAYIVEMDERGEYKHKYDYPAIFRIDRIQQYRDLEMKFQIPYSSRFEEGEFRKRIQFMFAGKLTKIQIKFTGSSVDAILDRLPTARILKTQEDGYVIEAEVYGKGIMMWLLSQGTIVELLKPESLRQELKETLLEILQKY